MSQVPRDVIGERSLLHLEPVQGVRKREQFIVCDRVLQSVDLYVSKRHVRHVTPVVPAPHGHRARAMSGDFLTPVDDFLHALRLNDAVIFLSKKRQVRRPRMKALREWTVTFSTKTVATRTVRLVFSLSMVGVRLCKSVAPKQ